MKNILFDPDLRIRKTSFQIATFYMLLIGFLYSLVIAKFASELWSVILLYGLQPFVVFAIPTVVLVHTEKKYSGTESTYRDSPAPIEKKQFVFVILLAMTAWLLYTYLSYTVAGFRSAITGGISLSMPVRPSAWQLVLSLLVNGVIVTLLREYVFRYLGKIAYGNSFVGYLLPCVLSALVCYDSSIFLRLLLLGVVASLIYAATDRAVFPFLFAVIFECLQVIIPSYWVLPLSAYGVTSRETALLCALFCGAVTFASLACAILLFKPLRVKFAKEEPRLDRNSILTYVLCIVTFIALAVWNKFI